jgi:hypothetical protein
LEAQIEKGNKHAIEPTLGGAGVTAIDILG